MAEEVAIPEHCQQILADGVYGTLTTIRKKDGLPSTNPVGYVWDGERIRISTLKSRIKYQRSILAAGGQDGAAAQQSAAGAKALAVTPHYIALPHDPHKTA